MSDVERRSAKLSKQSTVVDEEELILCPEPTVVTVITRPMGGMSTPTVLSASSSETSPDDTPPAKPTITRKQTLIRTPALEGTSPPPDSFFSQVRTNGGSGGGQEGTLLPNGRQRTSGQSLGAKEFLLASHELAVSNDSGRGTFDITDAVSEKSLSRTSSTETSNTSVSQQTSIAGQDAMYKDASGIDLIEFFKQTLQKSPKDKKTLFFLEKELHNFVKDESLQTKKLQEMNPYDRMLVHRLAAHMGIEHNVDQSGKAVIVGKTPITRIPENSLADYLRDVETDNHHTKKKILLKKPSSLDEKQSGGMGKMALGDMRTKSLEEREKVYLRARERIFAESQKDGSQTPTLLSASYAPSMLQHQGSMDGSRPSLAAARSNHLFKSADAADPAHLGVHRPRGTMTKSNSYAGCVSPHNLQCSPHPIVAPTCSPMHNSVLQDMHNMSESAAYGSPPPLLTTPNPGDTNLNPQNTADRQESSPQAPQSAACPTSYAYLVSSDYSSIPVGSLIINPHTMQPHVNSDGSMYRFDPGNPPPFMAPSQTAAPVSSTPPTQAMIYTAENSSTGQFARAASMPEGIAEPCAVGQMGQPMSMVPHMMPQVYASPTQPQLHQGQYFNPSPSPGQHSVRLIAINQGTAAPVETQGQTTVPMPAVQPYTAVQLVGGQHYQPVALTGQEDVVTGATYAQLTTGQETVAVNGGGQPHIVQGYSLAQAYPGQPGTGPYTHHVVHHPHQPTVGQAYGPVVSGATTYYAIPPSTPTPPPLLNQPPPPQPASTSASTSSGQTHHHAVTLQQQQQPQQQHQQQQQQQQPHVVAVHPSHQHHPHHNHQHHQQPQQHHQQTSPATAPPTPQIYSLLHSPTAGSTLTFPHPPTSSPSVKSWGAGTGTIIHPHYRPPSPPPQAQQVTINYLAPPPGPPQPGTQLVALPTAGYTQRPLGTVIQLGTTQGFQGQPYLYRPFPPLQGPASLGPRLPSLQLAAQSHGPQNQARPKLTSGGSKQKKGGGKKSLSLEEAGNGQAVNLVTPLIPGLPGAGTHTYIPPATSNRQ